MKFEVGKRYTRRDGVTVELLADLGTDEDRLVWVEPGTPHVTQTAANGEFLEGCEDELDVLLPLQRGTVWVNVYGLFSTCCETREIADMRAAEGDRIACVEVPWEEGQGL